MHSLDPFENRKMITAAVCGMFLLLLFGFGQLQIYSYQRRLASECDRLLFRFESVREYIIAALLEDRAPDLVAAIDELEEVNENLMRLLQNPVIPDEYKVPFMNRDDLAGVMLYLRQAAVDGDSRKTRALQEELRSFGDGIGRFHRLLSEHVKGKVIAYQALVIGVLILILLLLGGLVFYYHSRLYLPLARLRHRPDQPLVLSSRDRWLADVLRRLLFAQPEVLPATVLGRLTLGLCHEIGQTCNIIGNACQLAGEEEQRDATGPLIERITVANDRIAAVVRLLCSLGTEAAAPARPFSVERAVQEAGRLMSLGAVAGQAPVQIDRQGELGRGRGSVGAFKLVLVALYVELFDHGRGGRSVVCRRLDPYRVSVALEGAAGDTMRADADAPPVSHDTRIGLAFCRSMVEDVGGSLSVVDDRDGRRRVEILWPCSGA